MRKYLFIFIIAFSCGCATLGLIADEAQQMQSEEYMPKVNSIGVLIDDMIPAPYKMPAALGLGYLIALARRIYKRKKGAKST